MFDVNQHLQRNSHLKLETALRSYQSKSSVSFFIIIVTVTVIIIIVVVIIAVVIIVVVVVIISLMMYSTECALPHITALILILAIKPKDQIQLKKGLQLGAPILIPKLINFSGDLPIRIHGTNGMFSYI